MKPKNKVVLILASILFVCAGLLYFALQVWMPFMTVLAGVGLGSLGFGLYAERALVYDFMTLKTTRRGLSMGSIMALVFIILFSLNYLGVKFNRTFDFSQQEIYTLSDQTKKILDRLDSNLEINFFYKDGLANIDQEKKVFQSLARVYSAYSSRVLVQSIEMDANPAKTALFGADKGTGQAYIFYNGKINRIEAYSEQGFTNAIIKTTREHPKVIYFLEGHGESSLDDLKGENGIALFKDALEKNSLNVKTLNLTGMTEWPKDIDLLIIAGARQDFSNAEIKAIDSIMHQGKPTLIFPDSATPQLARMNGLLASMGLSLGSGYVFNIINSPQGPVVGTEEATNAHLFSEKNKITQYFSDKKRIVFYRPRALSVTVPTTGLEYDVLVRTPASSVELSKLNIKDFQGKPQSFNLGYEIRGRLLRLIIYADVSAISNALFVQGNNKELMLNSVSSLADEDDLIALAPKELKASKLKTSVAEFNLNFKYVLVGIFFPLPFLFLVLSFLIWFKRRHA